ncbi:MAG: hypothetical protein IH948_07235, partial [Bacteroidetes bacterium]|nr:hypothetical protein [Bacteroidota bacterium]
DRRFERLDPSRGRKAVVLAFCENAILDEWELLRTHGSGPAKGGASRSKKEISPEKLLLILQEVFQWKY